MNSKEPARLWRGYTVLELLVVIAIIGVLMAVGYANYRGYAQNQTVIAASRALRADLRLAQEEATAGRKPTGCLGYLIGYKFTVLSTTSYRIEASCSGGGILIKNVTVDSSVTISTPNPNPILFKSLAQGTNLAANRFAVVGITQQTTNNYASILINASGNIEESFATPAPTAPPTPTPSPAPTPTLAPTPTPTPSFLGTHYIGTWVFGCYTPITFSPVLASQFSFTMIAGGGADGTISYRCFGSSGLSAFFPNFGQEFAQGYCAYKVGDTFQTLPVDYRYVTSALGQLGCNDGETATVNVFYYGY